MNEQKKYSLKELILYFLKLGATGFGGPVALVGYMHRDLVENKKWISEDEYKEGLALSQLAPGPLASQLAIYIGYVHYGVFASALVGLAFVIPSFIIVVLIGMAYKVFGGLPWMQAVFYGVSASVIGIIVISSYKLTTKSISKFELEGFKSKWLLWLFFIIMAIVTAVTQTEEVTYFILAGFIYMLVVAPPKYGNKLASVSLLFAGTGFWQYDNHTLSKIAVFFFKAGAFVFGSGLAIVPFLHGGVVKEFAWLTEHQFVDAVAVAMITPGPVVITVGFIGFLVAGFPGAAIAAAATFLPCYLFTIIPAPYFKKIAKNKSIKAFVEGITAAVIGALVGAVIVIASRSIIDIPTALVALFTVIVLLKFNKVKEQHVIFVAALFGLIYKSIGIF
jgi:chromate transporter